MLGILGEKGHGDLVTMNELLTEIISKGADIVGFISFGISVVTLVNTRKIRSSMVAHVETSEFRKEIDEQIGELEAFRDILVEGNGLDSQFFLQLMVQLRDICISYETILPPKLTKKMTGLNEHTKNNLYSGVTPYRKKDLEKCISMLVEIISELKKEKKII